jgi:hypothetical protein
MADTHSGARQPAPGDWSAAFSEVIPYLPPDAELDAIRGYLRDVRAAAEQLPELTSTTAPLDGGYDPRWLEDQR